MLLLFTIFVENTQQFNVKIMEIISILKDVEDPRRDHLKEHSLECIFYIAMTAVLCGAESWYDIEQFGLDKESFFCSRIKDFKGIPSHDTFNRVFSILDPKVLENSFRNWIKQICGKYTGVVPIDGKEICGARINKIDGSFEPLRIVSAWAAENGVTLGQEKVGKKTNEINAIPKLIDALDLKDCIITIDAIGCQKDIIKKIVKKEAHFIICVKRNQEKLYNLVKELMDEDLDGEHSKGHVPPTRYQKYISEGTAHGRREKRICQVYCSGNVDKILKWDYVKSMVKLTNIKTDIRKKKTVVEEHYYITSIGLEPQKIAAAIRQHWSIENNLHWQLDVTFNEDKTRMTRNAAVNFSLLNKIALSIIKHNAKKCSLRVKRKSAGWNEKYLAELLDGNWV